MFKHLPKTSSHVKFFNCYLPCKFLVGGDKKGLKLDYFLFSYNNFYPRHIHGSTLIGSVQCPKRALSYTKTVTDDWHTHSKQYH